MKPFYSGCEAMAYAEHQRAWGPFTCLVVSSNHPGSMKHACAVGRYLGQWTFMFTPANPGMFVKGWA